MPLYNSIRDSGFLKGINKELLHGIMSVEVGIYKLDKTNMSENMYGESENKLYKNPVRVFSLIRIDQVEASGDDMMLDYNRTAAFGFLKSDLRDVNLYLEVGDIIIYDEKYYEVDVINNNNYWSGRNPNTMIGTLEDKWSISGYDQSVTAETHLTRLNNLHIIDVREGNNSPTIKNINQLKFL